MKKSFTSIVDVNFTAYLEGLLDRVEDGSVRWKTIVENFYPDLHEAVAIAEKELEEVKIEDEVTDVICEECGRNMVVKFGTYGKFLACPGFPDCRNTKPYLEKAGVPCPKCGQDIVIRKTKKGRCYFSCVGYPECDLCHGRSLQQKNALNVEAQWLKKAANLHVWITSVVLQKQKSQKNKKIIKIVEKGNES